MWLLILINSVSVLLKHMWDLERVYILINVLCLFLSSRLLQFSKQNKVGHKYPSILEKCIPYWLQILKLCSELITQRVTERPFDVRVKDTKPQTSEVSSNSTLCTKPAG